MSEKMTEKERRQLEIELYYCTARAAELDNEVTEKLNLRDELLTLALAAFRGESIMKKWYCTAEVASTTQRPHQVGFSIEAEDAKEAFEKASEEARRVFGKTFNHDIKLDVAEILQVIQEVEPE